MSDQKPQQAERPVNRPVLFIGAGNMGGAVMAAALDSGVVRGDALAVASPNAPKRHLSLPNTFTEPATAMGWLRGREEQSSPGMVFLGVKPQMLPGVAEVWRPLLADCRRPVVSMLAGVRAATVRKLLGETADVIRIMPNTPAAIGCGCCAIASDADAEADAIADVRRIVRATGMVVEVPEDRFDAFTAVAGSGPAYLFYLAEAMARAGEQLGLDATEDIVRQTLLGASMLLDREKLGPSELRSRVTSKNGTTFAATETFDRLGVASSVEAGVRSAAARGRELADEIDRGIS